jgi:iron-sulfur cluster assembly protein
VSISVSERAVQEIGKAGARRPSPPKGLRVGIRGGGCTGFTYFFEWSDVDPRPEDKVLEHQLPGGPGPVRVFVDPKSYVFLEGSTLDYATTLMARGFKWVNPNAKGTCGCGESVSF